jgi:hypothetical protein
MAGARELVYPEFNLPILQTKISRDDTRWIITGVQGVQVCKLSH